MSLSQIPVVIFAGGRGARFDHESQVLPKPMISVAGKPILRHIIDSLVGQGFREFIVAAGYLGERIGEYFGNIGSRRVRSASYGLYRIPMTLGDDSFDVSVTVADTGLDAHTGLRLARVSGLITGRRFVLTYGDGLSDVSMAAVISQHERDRALVTMTAVHPPGRFGTIEFCGFTDPTEVLSFNEHASDAWINGGYMVVEPGFMEEYIKGGPEFESHALPSLCTSGRLCAYRHDGYWRCMDTRRDLEQIEADAAATPRLPWF